MTKPLFLFCFVCSLIGAVPASSADRLLGVQSARVMPRGSDHEVALCLRFATQTTNDELQRSLLQ